MTEQSTQAEIREIVANIDRAHHERDARAIVSHYTPDALLFDLAPPLARAVEAAEIDRWFKTWQGPVTRETRELRITQTGDLAFAHCYFRTAAVTKDGGEDAQWWSRATLCFTRSDGRWRIAHEHISVPFYMDGSFKAALDLEP